MTAPVVIPHSPAETPFAHDRLFLRRHRDDRTARRVAQAAAAFEHVLFGRAPISVTVAVKDDSMVVTIFESFSRMERRLVRRDDGRQRVDEFHHSLFDSTIDSFCDHVRRGTGVDLRRGLIHVDAETGSITKTLATDSDIDLFLLGDGLPALGVPVDVHLYATGTDGKGPVRD